MRSTKERRFAARWIYGVVYDGTREELIAAGVVAHGEFPGDPGRRVYAYTIDSGRKIQRVQRSPRFLVWVTDEHQFEIARRDEAFRVFLARSQSRREGAA